MLLSRVARWLLGVVAVEAALLVALSWIIPGFHFARQASALSMALIIVAAQAVLWPLVYREAVQAGPWLFPLVSFLLSGALIAGAAWLDQRFFFGGVEVADLWTGVLVAIGLAAGTTLLAALFAFDDEPAYERFVTAPMRRRFRDVPRTGEPGFLFLEIDGLAEPILCQAMGRGDMPTLRRWLNAGSHRLTSWEPDLSAQTSASQAGILLGSNEGIPAFRWWDKPRQALMVTSRRGAVRALEETLSTGEGLLARGGAGRWNVFSGDAVESIGVYSVFGQANQGAADTLLAYLLTPYMLGRIVTLYGVDVVREWRQAWRQRRDNVTPRVSRELKTSLKRAATTVAMQEASRAILTADVLRGRPAVYVTFYGYDEVAHHAGIDREDAFAVLRTIDTVFAYLERVTQEAPRPYYLIVLSDHGQSQGATFKQRFGMTLGDLTRELMAEDEAAAVTMVEEFANAEEMGHINVALGEATRGDTRSARLLRRLLKPRPSGDVLDVEPSPREAMNDGAATPEVIVLASGNLGVISFPRWPERVSREQITARYPRLIPGLVAHPGIAFVMAHDERRGPLVIGEEGTHVLHSGEIAGDDPLAPYGDRAAHHLRRTAGFGNMPDLLVISAIEPTTGEVPAFEELVGNHGGLGGPQQEPFLLYPAAFDPGAGPIVGAEHLHDVLKGWIEREQGNA